METTFTPLSPDAETFCRTLGEIIVRWNNTEAMVRLLLYAAVDPPRPGHKVDVLITHLGKVALQESLKAVADAYHGPLRSHLKHCADLFDAHRIYRNHFAHDPIEFATREDGEFIAFTQTQTAKGGALRLSQGHVKQGELFTFLQRLDAFRRYTSDLVSILYGMKDREQLASLPKPSLPDKLVRHYLNLIEHERQRLEREA